MKQNEGYFYGKDGDTDDFNFPPLLDQYMGDAAQWPQFSSTKPYIKEKIPGRNDLCHCGSGKKYKKCCMDKDG